MRPRARLFLASHADSAHRSRSLLSHRPGTPRGRQPTQPQGTGSSKLLGRRRPAWPTAGGGWGQGSTSPKPPGTKLSGLSPLGTGAEGRMQETANSPRLLSLKSSKRSCPSRSDFVFRMGGSSPPSWWQTLLPGEPSPVPSLSTSAADGVTILWLWLQLFVPLPHPIQGISQECPQLTPQGPAQSFLASDCSLAPWLGSPPTGQGIKPRGPPHPPTWSSFLHPALTFCSPAKDTAPH